MIEGHATSRYVRTSAQKAGLVLDQIRGRDVTRALAALRFSPKLIARDIEKVLRSAIANAQQQEGFSGDVERLYVVEAWANQGPSMKRIRPAPMGRAFRVVKRTAHLTVGVAERVVKPKAAPAAGTTPARASKRKDAGAKSEQKSDSQAE
jgi:large subunit ribosomal protein L22